MSLGEKANVRVSFHTHQRATSPRRPAQSALLKASVEVGKYDTAVFMVMIAEAASPCGGYCSIILTLEQAGRRNLSVNQRWSTLFLTSTESRRHKFVAAADPGHYLHTTSSNSSSRLASDGQINMGGPVLYGHLQTLTTLNCSSFWLPLMKKGHSLSPVLWP